MEYHELAKFVAQFHSAVAAEANSESSKKTEEVAEHISALVQKAHKHLGGDHAAQSYILGYLITTLTQLPDGLDGIKWRIENFNNMEGE